MKTIVILATLLIAEGFSMVKTTTAEVCLTAEEQKLYELIMAYRKSKNLKPIPLSGKLSLVAQTHARDLMANYTFDVKNRCNPHSWSGKGNWSSCCYTNDHKRAKCMWDKPREIADYPADGFEIAYYSSKGASAEEGLEGWKLSPGHNPVIINEGTWSKIEWKAIGIGIYGEYGIVWFGAAEDTSEVGSCL